MSTFPAFQLFFAVLLSLPLPLSALFRSACPSLLPHPRIARCRGKSFLTPFSFLVILIIYSVTPSFPATETRETGGGGQGVSGSHEQANERARVKSLQC